MIHIHPFPARMAPELALAGMEDLPRDYVVLDPMSGSGMVLGTAAKLGIHAIGYDLDPLACLISKVNGTKINEKDAHHACEHLIFLCREIVQSDFKLPWIDAETQEYMNFWFAAKQQMQLRTLAYYLVAKPFLENENIVNALKIAVSRLIVTKEPKASLARDAAHSRPHRTILENDFDIFDAIPKSLTHVLKALSPAKIHINAVSYRGDARRMEHLPDSSVDGIVTSPPYLNAIDYMRGHRLSLVWLGFSVSQIRSIRASSVGAEISDGAGVDCEIVEFMSQLHKEIDSRKRKILLRYYKDIRQMTDEAFRVLRPNRRAVYVIGNSCVKGHEIRNSELLIISAKMSGFQVVEQNIRNIPENKRYMPVRNTKGSGIANRMRTEHVLTFEKAGP